MASYIFESRVIYWQISFPVLRPPQDQVSNELVQATTGKKDGNMPSSSSLFPRKMMLCFFPLPRESCIFFIKALLLLRACISMATQSRLQSVKIPRQDDGISFLLSVRFYDPSIYIWLDVSVNVHFRRGRQSVLQLIYRPCKMSGITVRSSFARRPPP